MWAAIALLFRVWEERKRSLETGQPLFGEASPVVEETMREEEYEPDPAHAIPSW
jgi:hypothetical protein